jgi:signal peptidase II
MQTNTKRCLILGLITTVTFIIDQVSKWWVDKNIELGGSIPIIQNFFHLTYVRNTGIVFGFFTNKPWIFWLTSLLGVGVIGYILFYIYQNINKFNALKIVAYGLIGGGALGNSYDRFVQGYVIDFIDVNGVWSFIFNGADMFINIAIFLLLVDSYLKKEN